MDDDAAAPSPISSAAVNVVKALEDEEERERWMLTWSCGRGWCYNGYKQQQQQSRGSAATTEGESVQYHRSSSFLWRMTSLSLKNM
ncbi:hypothetical protein JOB18_013813 [Solea senegalensis]|uniref:Uncharacterized protein n=1 Tax=Solea senegalensis TaxID=28829 RepID=A0AAV6Q7J7_SOLSE|nr:hypothetical protein JOB18_013813 [Solea senegalensis]KAG7485579.1 hypothetical protein JOB18_013813 [Solea senegalensis]